MCGICGEVNFEQKASHESLRRMASTLVHRGPDDEGFYLDTHVGLGHRRLSIIDLMGGNQPMSNEDGTVWVVFNGEIYNFQTLRNHLTRQGHVFKTRSDTEVLVHLYEEKGTSLVEALDGMFAFGIWDAPRKRLLLVRDRVGKKPLYYFFDGKRFLFGSEMKAILSAERIPRDVDPEAVDLFMTYGYVPSPRTIFRGIRKLPPAHFLVYEKGQLHLERYWKVSYQEKRYDSIDEACEILLSLLEECVKKRMISDVPLGAFLSGGLDSSSVVAFMSEHCDHPVKTFTVGFEEADFSEMGYARQVAQRFGTDHREFIVRPNMIEILPKLVWHYNEPFGDSSCLPSYYLARMTREHVTVALNGDGGDENFGGYDRYAGIRMAEWFKRIPAIFIRLGTVGLNGLLPFGNGRAKRWLSRRRNFFEALLRSNDLLDQYLYWITFFMQAEKDALYTEEFKQNLHGSSAPSYFKELVHAADAPSWVEKMMQAELLSYLPEDLLVKMDIATMAHGLEARSPFLDHRLLEFSATLPVAYKVRGWKTKVILKRAMRGLLPETILRRPKMGFGLPIGHWFRTELKGFVAEILLDSRSCGRGYFKRQAIENLLQEHGSAQRDHTHRIWALLNLEFWHRLFIDQKTASTLSSEFQ